MFKEVIVNQGMFRLDGEVAIVTGGSRGIGRAISLGLATFGANVVVCSRNLANCKKVANEVQQMGRKALAIAVDVTQPNEITSMVEEVKAEFGKIDILVNSAGMGGVARTYEVTEETWNSIVGLNLKGTFLCCQAVSKEMIAQKRGNIINISSMMGVRGAYGHAAYGASKAGIDQLTRVLAVEWCRHNIRVNALAPGWVDTDITRAIPNDVREKLTERIPMKRFAMPEEMVGTVLYLASNMSSYTTGAVLYIDGGMTASL